MTELKDKLVEAYENASKLLKEGNYRGFPVLQRRLNSLVELSDDKEIMFQYYLLCGLTPEWLEFQTERKNGKNFLKELGARLEDIGKTYDANDVDSMNQKLRDLLFMIHQRGRVVNTLE